MGLSAWFGLRWRTALMVVALMGALGAPAFAASPGCNAVNAGAINGLWYTGTPHNLVGTSFAAGEQLTLTVLNPTFDTPILNGALTLTLGAQVSVQNGPGFNITGYTTTLTANGTETTASMQITGLFGADGDGDIIVTCFDPNAPAFPKKNLTKMQTKSKLPAVGSGSIVSNAIGAAVTSAFGSCDAVTPLPDGVRVTFSGWHDRDPACYDDNRRQNASTANGTRRPIASRVWQLWMELRGTHYSASQGTDSTSGTQVNALVGISRHVTTDLIVGIYAGYENFRFTSEAINGRLSGSGGTIGNYLGWRIAEGIRFDAAYGYTRVGYDVSATDIGGFASGAFNGDRWMFMTGLSGNYVWQSYTLEPSARIFWLNERQAAYTDSSGAAMPAQRFATGRVSGGNKLIFPTQKLAIFAFAPYIGLYGDYYFNSDSSTTGLNPGEDVLTLQGWSARATAGVTVKLRGGAELMGGGEYGGIGGAVHVWTYRARASVPF